jgi:hypothetical protein
VGAHARLGLVLRNLSPEELETRWPKLKAGNYRYCSQATPRYNCVALAVGDERHWWEQGIHGGRVRWEQGAGDDVDGWAQVFIRAGYQQAELNTDREPGYEKVAIYVGLEDLRPTHVAKSDGSTWKSKLGKLQDIEHESLELLEGDAGWEYGIVERILKRRLQ